MCMHAWAFVWTCNRFFSCFHCLFPPQLQRPFDAFHDITAKLRQDILSPVLKKSSQ